MRLVFILGLLIISDSDMKIFWSIWCFLFVITMMTGCEKTGLDEPFPPPTKVYDLSLEGGINTLYPNQYIRLTKPAVNASAEATPIVKASVVVNDGRSNIVFKETSPGLYMGVTSADPNYNAAYTLTIKYNNEVYTAVDTLRQVVNIIDDFLPLSAKNGVNGLIEGVIPKHTFGYLNANKWFISYQDIPGWNPGKFDQSKYYSYTHLLGSPNSLYPLNTLKRNFSLGGDDVISIFKISLSDGYAKYLYAVFMETDWSGLFSGVPVNAKGNLSGNAQGYFSAVDVDLRRYRAKALL